MTDITDAQAIAFSEEHFRRLANLITGSYQTAKSVQVRWGPEGLAAKFPDTDDDIMDSAHVDGRTIVTGADANAMKAAADALVALLEANGGEHLNTVVKYGTKPRE